MDLLIIIAISVILLTVLIFILVVRHYIKRDVRNTFEEIKGRFDYMVGANKDNNLDLSRMVEVGYSRRNPGTAKIVNHDHFYEVQMSKGKFKDSYYYIPPYTIWVNKVPPIVTVTANIKKSYMHEAHLDLVESISFNQVNAERCLSRKEIDVILNTLRVRHTRVKYTDFKIAYGKLMVRISDDSNYESTIEQIVPFC